MKSAAKPKGSKAKAEANRMAEANGRPACWIDGAFQSEAWAAWIRGLAAGRA